MKIALVVLGAIVLLVVVVVAIGAMLPKGHVATRSARYSASADRLFGLIAGPQDWRPDMLLSDEFAEGGRTFVRETMRDKETITYELLNRDKPRSVERRIATENLPYSGTWTIVLEPSDSGTVVRITERGEVSNPVFRFVSRFILGHTQTMDAYLRALGKSTGQDVEPVS
jgi:hypothetical protein